jgi:D-glycero-D-manno-heptose 1,7-bisphosphate phosphatase
MDRDGTLNVQVIRGGNPFAPASVAEFRLFPGVPEACRALHAAGYVLVVATNQPDVGRGTQSQAAVEAMHAELRRFIPEIARVDVCYAPGLPGSPPDPRRKPEPGMLLDAARELGLDLARSWMIGDRWRDIDCGKNAGVRTIFIDFHYAESLRARPDFVVQSFGDAARIILADPEARKLNPSH